MQHFNYLALIALLLVGADAHAQTRSTADCSFDRHTLMALDYLKFDQDTVDGGGGWRKFDTPACRLVAAQLLSEYRTTHPGLKKSEIATLYWHEGQMLAFAGKTQDAVRAMKHTFHPKQYDIAGWNAYVDATIAFLLHDSKRLQRAQQTLAKTPPMEGVTVKDGAATMKADNGQEMRIDWPPNSGIVEGFVRCFDKTYLEAYKAPCRTGVQ